MNQYSQIVARWLTALLCLSLASCLSNAGVGDAEVRLDAGIEDGGALGDSEPSDSGSISDDAGVFADATSIDASTDSGPGPADAGLEPRPFSAEIVQALDSVVAAANANNAGTGAVVFRVEARGQNTLYEGAAGQLAIGGRQMTVPATFEIASTTKALTAVAALLLVDDGVIGLDDRVDAHLPNAVVDDLLVIDGVQRGGEITIRQLLLHRSGLPHYWTDPPFVQGTDNAFITALYDDPDHFWTPLEILSHVKAQDSAGPPGAQFHYADGGYLILGMIIEAVSGQTLAAFYRQRIFTPLGMTSASLSYREPRASGIDHAHLYWGDDDRTDVTAMSADWAGGGLIMNAGDLATFLSGVVEGELLSPASLAALRLWSPTTDQGIDYGLGFYRVNYTSFPGFERLGEVYGHDGYGGAFVYYWPQRDIILSGSLNHAEEDCFTQLIEPALFALEP